SLGSPGGAAHHARRSPRDTRRLRPPALRAQLSPPLRRARLVDGPRRGIEEHAVVVARGLEAYQLVPDVPKHARRVTLERVPPPAGPRLLGTEDIAPLHRRRQLPG